MAGSSSNPSLKDYLKRYENNSEKEEKKKKKKKKKTKEVEPGASSGVLVVDEDPIWQKPVVLEEEEENDSPDEEKPTVDEDIEVKRMRRLDLLRSRRDFNAIAEDGSGWVTLSPKRKGDVEPSLDMSPPRRVKARNDTPSPEPQGRHLGLIGEDTDLSPPRQPRVRRHTPSPEPDVDCTHGVPDMSPPRRWRPSLPDQDNARALPGSDLSPPRKNRRDIGRLGLDDLSPPRSSRRPSTEKGSSRASMDQDISPPRKNRKEPIVPASSKERPKTGLISGRDMRDEIIRTKKDELLRFEQMDPSISGKGAEGVYRDQQGKRISKEEYLKLNQKVEEKPKEKKLEWGKGLAQKREAETRLLELELEKEKPFAQTRDDPELDNMLKERVRWGDPMAHLVKKKHSEPVLPNLGDSEKMKESGFIIPQDIPSHSWIKRRLDAGPNRYGIKPGRHWDGVDRSNGYEKQLFKRMNEKQATQREAYLWSVSDM